MTTYTGKAIYVALGACALLACGDSKDDAASEPAAPNATTATTATSATTATTNTIAFPSALSSTGFRPARPPAASSSR